MYINSNSVTTSAGEPVVEVDYDGFISIAGDCYSTQEIGSGREIDVVKIEALLRDGHQEQQEDYKILDVHSFLEHEVTRKVIYLEPLVRMESIVMITGSSGVGKTMFTLALCKSLVSGESFGNWKVSNRTKVLYVDGELPAYLLQERVKGFNIGEGFYVFSSSINRDKNFSLGNEVFRERIKCALLEQGIGLCVFDNLSSLTPGLDENSKRDWDLINQYLLDLRRNGITSIIIHHTTKNKKEQRGTSGRTDNIDVWCNIERDERTRNLKLTFRKWRYEPSDLLNDNTFSMDGYNWAPVNRPSEIRPELRQILEMLGRGIPQTEIAKRLDVTQPYIAKVKKQFVQEGLLDGGSKLTERGASVLV